TPARAPGGWFRLHHGASVNPLHRHRCNRTSLARSQSARSLARLGNPGSTDVATRRIPHGDLLRRRRRLLIRADRRHHGHSKRHGDVAAAPGTHTTTRIALWTRNGTWRSSPNTFGGSRRLAPRASTPRIRTIPLSGAAQASALDCPSSGGQPHAYP